MIPAEELRIQVLRDFAEAQRAWQSHELARAQFRFWVRLSEQRANWEEQRRVTLATSAPHRERHAQSQTKYERKRWAATRSDPAKRAAHNAKRMAAYYRKKGKVA